jgi:hypothetical protein
VLAPASCTHHVVHVCSCALHGHYILFCHDLHACCALPRAWPCCVSTAWLAIDLMALSMQPTTLIQPNELHLLSGRRRLRPFVSSRGGNGRLQVHAVAVRDTSSERKPALLAGSGHAGGGHSDRKKVLIVGAGWAGASNTFHASWRCSVCTSAWPLWRHAPSPCDATCHRLWCSKAPVAAGLRGDAAGCVAKPRWPVFGMEDPTGPGRRSGWEQS